MTIDPEQLAIGPDGNIGVALNVPNEIARIIPGDTPTTPGAITTFPPGIAGGHPVGIATGADGLIYYSDNSSCDIGRMNTAGVQVGGLAAVGGGGCNLWQLGTDGAAGNIWFIDSGHNEVGYIPEGIWPSPGTDCGVLPTPNSFFIGQSIVQQANGTMWFTAGGNGHKIGTYANAAGCASQTGLTEYTPSSAGNNDLSGTVLGSDGNRWFTELVPDLYAKITPAGAINQYPNVINPAAFANPNWIVAAGNGVLWIPQGGGAVSFLPGTPTTSNVPSFVSSLNAILGPDGNIWFSGQGSNPGEGYAPTQDEVAKFVPR